MLTPEDHRKLSWVPYVMDFSFEDDTRFAAALSAANRFEDLPQWVKDAAEAADRRVGVHLWDHVVDLPHQRTGGVGAGDHPHRHITGTEG
jgi:hypothetical protein